MALRNLGGDLLYIRRRIFCTKKKKRGNGCSLFIWLARYSAAPPSMRLV